MELVGVGSVAGVIYVNPSKSKAELENPFSSVA